MTVTINEETLQDVIDIEIGLLAPLTGFVETMLKWRILVVEKECI